MPPIFELQDPHSSTAEMQTVGPVLHINWCHSLVGFTGCWGYIGEFVNDGSFTIPVQTTPPQGEIKPYPL